MKLRLTSFFALFLLVSCSQSIKKAPKYQEVEISSNTAPSEAFNSSLDFNCILDGIINLDMKSESEWMCFNEPAIDLQLDFQKTKTFKHFEIVFLTDNSKGIVLPSGILIKGARGDEPFFELAKLNSKHIVDLRNNAIRINFTEQGFDKIKLSIENERQSSAYIGISEVTF